eukprot:m.274685 g.274685  ORF g.274685 m.274685 type:complete len:55 (+) comp40587_c0_seq25:563-727(+)
MTPTRGVTRTFSSSPISSLSFLDGVLAQLDIFNLLTNSSPKFRCSFSLQKTLKS